MKKRLTIFAAGAFVGCLATGSYFIWQKWKCLDLAWTDPKVTVAEAQRVFAGCYQPILRGTSGRKWEREMRERETKREKEAEGLKK